MLERHRESDTIPDIHYENSNIILLNLYISSSLSEGKNTQRNHVSLIEKPSLSTVQ